MSVRRRQQVGSILRDEISAVVRRQVKDPRVGFATITEVEMSPDMRHAKVFVSVLGTQEEQHKTLEAMESARGFIARQVGPKLRLRYIPQLSFVLDNSMEHAERISRLLNQMNVEPPASKHAEQAENGGQDE
jgi:ribosome-binding factor A